VAFVREALVPTPAAGQVVVMDNLGPHKSPAARAPIEAAGARLVLRPPYSPDLNPIEMAISTVKTYLRALARRSVDGLIAGIGEALGQVTSTDATHYIEHCGYTLQ
jgi:transposase